MRKFCRVDVQQERAYPKPYLPLTPRDTTRQLTCNMLTLHLKATQLIAAKVNKISRTNFRVAFVLRLP